MQPVLVDRYIAHQQCELEQLPPFYKTRRGAHRWKANEILCVMQ
jgi:hypothetical protein